MFCFIEECPESAAERPWERGCEIAIARKKVLYNLLLND